MNSMQKYTAPGITLTAILLVALVALLASCEKSGQAAESSADRINIDQQDEREQPLGDVAEFEGFTIRANVIPTGHLPDAMAQKYGVEADPDLFLLNVLILENQPEQQQPVPVPGELSAYYEGLTGRSTDIDMREVRANDRVSYIGTLDTSTQRIFQIVIKAQTENADQPLHMSFEVQIP